jgi:multiple sugar transport system ATP-binding protein
MIKTDLVKEGGRYYVTPFGARIEVDGEKGEELIQKGVKPGPVTLGVRPEHMVLAPEGGQDAIPCMIEVNEMMGSELHLHLSSANDDKIIVRLPTVDLTKEQRESLSYGSRMYITFPAKVMHLFDPETERSLIDG